MKKKTTKAPTAADRTIPLFIVPTEEDVTRAAAEIRREEDRERANRGSATSSGDVGESHRSPVQEALDRGMLSWVDAPVPDGRCLVRVARYRNGNRGVQVARMSIAGRPPSYTSATLLSEEGWRALQLCALRDIDVVRRLMETRDAGLGASDADVDELIRLVRGK